MVETGKEYRESGTKETCLLVDFEKLECSYDCNCDSSGDGNDCDTCYGNRYLYSATVESKCGNETLFQTADDLYTCPEDFIKMDTEKTCYVLDCEESEFTFYSYSSRITWGVVFIVFASLLFCCGLCGICAGICAGINALTSG